MVNELLATWKNHKPNGVFVLINKILLFQYSEGIFSAHKGAVTCTQYTANHARDKTCPRIPSFLGGKSP